MRTSHTLNADQVGHATSQACSDVALPRWPHRLAVVAMCATFPLIWVGGLVTTYDAGMAVPDWPNTFGYNLFLYPWQTWLTGPFDLFIEHGHRLLGALVGILTLATAVVVWRAESRRWVRWFSVFCVLGVVGQGVLGGMRVILDERTLAKIHGCTGPCFFAMLVGLAVVTSTRWQRARQSRLAKALPAPLLAAAGIVTALTLLQIILGAQLRHLGHVTSVGFFRAAVVLHIVTAVVLWGQTLWLAWHCWRLGRLEADGGGCIGFRGRLKSALLVALVSAQVGLGVASWTVKYGVPALVSEYWLIGYTVGAKSFSQGLS